MLFFFTFSLSENMAFSKSEGEKFIITFEIFRTVNVAIYELMLSGGNVRWSLKQRELSDGGSEICVLM